MWRIEWLVISDVYGWFSILVRLHPAGGTSRSNNTGRQFNVFPWFHPTPLSQSLSRSAGNRIVVGYFYLCRWACARNLSLSSVSLEKNKNKTRYRWKPFLKADRPSLISGMAGNNRRIYRPFRHGNQSGVCSTRQAGSVINDATRNLVRRPRITYKRKFKRKDERGERELQ